MLKLAIVFLSPLRVFPCDVLPCFVYIPIPNNPSPLTPFMQSAHPTDNPILFYLHPYSPLISPTTLGSTLCLGPISIPTPTRSSHGADHAHCHLSPASSFSFTPVRPLSHSDLHPSPSRACIHVGLHTIPFFLHVHPIHPTKTPTPSNMHPTGPPTLRLVPETRACRNRFPVGIYPDHAVTGFWVRKLHVCLPG